MAELTRSPDYLRITASTARRVRNLETGVHPTSSGLNYYDTFGPIQFDFVDGAEFTSPSLAERAGWQRRMGIVQTFGMLRGTWGPDASEYVSKLPPEARPRLPVHGVVPMTNSPPYIAFVLVETNGDFFLEKAFGTTEGIIVNMHLTSLSWAVN